MLRIQDQPELRRTAEILSRFRESEGRLVVLTGAGISAESGIPTFRGKDGFWTRGSEAYRPEDIATFAYFQREPDVVRDWYLERLESCRDARPNAAHEALVRLEAGLQDRFLLVTQNVDDLH
ncbi:MAG: RNA polymerase subunit sigma, partial [Planctomycetes bacterium]|nr:RNA polymerase subunit sigma [Planctomycetota bacterium]